MDIKSMAKSKRSHSQHLKKSHHRANPNSSKTSTTPTGKNGQKQPTSKVPDQHVRSVSQRLPSNWERYDVVQEDQEEDGKLGSCGASDCNEIVKPKSKGADYRELISQALSSGGHYICDGGFYSLDDTLMPELKQSFGSILSIRGLAIQSRTADDNFIVDEKATSSHEAPFFSLNLKTLAEQLENVDLSQRLFIEGDLLPPEMNTQGFKAKTSKESERVQTKVQEDVITRTHGEMNFPSKSNGEEGNSTEYDRRATLPYDLLTYQSKETDGMVGELAQSSLLDVSANIKSDSVKYSANKSSLFEAADCGAELDMLLESVSQTDLTGSSGFQESRSIAISHELQKGTTVSQPKFTREVVVSSKMTTTSSVKFDDALDELLAETSYLTQQNDIRHHVVRKGTIASFDDHLEETLNVVNQHGASDAHKFRAIPPEIITSGSSVSSSKSKMLDDFDAWMDTF